jgi:hypothetical protein
MKLSNVIQQEFQKDFHTFALLWTRSEKINCLLDRGKAKMSRKTCYRTIFPMGKIKARGRGFGSDALACIEAPTTVQPENLPDINVQTRDSMELGKNL